MGLMLILFSPTPKGITRCPRVRSVRHAVILASYCEGFGLPLVEAASYAKAIIASDIPIFREIGGSAPLFFEAGDSESLQRAVLEFIKLPGTVQAATLPWLSWSDSADILVDVINKLRALPPRVLTAPVYNRPV
jgi:glycosyltransferase involved in cell wall biosynthesis